LDSGALYRLVALKAQQEGVGAEDETALAALAASLPVEFLEGEAYLDGERVGDAIRTESIGNAASKVASVPEVRSALLQWQRDYAQPPGLVADGRDMGTVVFPHAAVKIFLTASAEERAERRYKQLKGKGMNVSLPDLAAEIRERDERDRNRSVAPLQAADSALEVDSTSMTIDEVVDRVMDQVHKTFPDLC